MHVNLKKKTTTHTHKISRGEGSKNTQINKGGREGEGEQEAKCDERQGDQGFIG